MRRQIAMTTVACIVVAALASACSSSSKSSTAVTTTIAATTSTPATTGQPASPTSTPPTSATLRVVTNVKLGKPIIVDAAGRTVYMYAPDGSSTTSKVPAALKTAWPPVVVSGTVIAGSGLSAAKLAAHPQAGGALQVAYGGHLLYTFANDKAPGDATGQALGGIWFTLSPAGAKIP